jgi:Carboxypeptidase regulatory-like domain
MKATQFKLAALAIAAAGLFAFHAMVGGSIKGKVTPTDAAVRVWAESATDTLNVAIQSGGDFEIANVKPGTYKLVVEAKPPYKNIAKDNVSVMDGQPTDVGEIMLNK